MIDIGFTFYAVGDERLAVPLRAWLLLYADADVVETRDHPVVENVIYGLNEVQRPEGSIESENGGGDGYICFPVGPSFDEPKVVLCDVVTELSAV